MGSPPPGAILPAGRLAVEGAARDPRCSGDALRGLAARHAARDERARPRHAPPPARRPPRPPPRFVPVRRAPTRPRRPAPRGRGSCRRPPAPRASPSGPRTTCSWSFVSSRHTAPGRSSPQAAGEVAQRGREPRRRLEQDRSPARRRRSRPAAPAARGRSAAGTPRTTSADPRRRDEATAASTADAPGIGDHRAARRRPGRDEPLARVGHDGRAGVRDEREVRAAARDARAARARGPGRSARGSSPSGWRSRTGRAAGA